jgi:hypothetical protein
VACAVDSNKKKSESRTLHPNETVFQFSKSGFSPHCTILSNKKHLMPL